MGNPTGERQKSEVAEQVITTRADIAFQVNIINSRIEYYYGLNFLCFLENGHGPGRSDYHGGFLGLL